MKNHYTELAWLVSVTLTIVFFALHLEGWVALSTTVYVFIASLGNVILTKMTNTEKHDKT